MKKQSRLDVRKYSFSQRTINVCVTNIAMIMTSFTTLVKILCACILPQRHVNHMNVSFRLTRNPFSMYGKHDTWNGVVIQSSGTAKDVHRQMRKYYAGINTLIRRLCAWSYDVKCYLLLRIYRTCTVGNRPTGSIAPNSVVNKLRVSYNNNCRGLPRLPIVPVECLSLSAIFCHLENV